MYEQSKTVPVGACDFSIPNGDSNGNSAAVSSFSTPYVTTWAPVDDGRNFWERVFFHARDNDQPPISSVDSANLAHDAWLKRFGPK